MSSTSNETVKIVSEAVLSRIAVDESKHIEEEIVKKMKLHSLYHFGLQGQFGQIYVARYDAKPDGMTFTLKVFRNDSRNVVVNSKDGGSPDPQWDPMQDISANEVAAYKLTQSHANICKFHELVVVDIMFPTYVIKLEGVFVSLEDLLRDNIRTLNHSHVFRVLKHIGRALNYLHNICQIAHDEIDLRSIAIKEYLDTSMPHNLVAGLMKCTFKLCNFAFAKYYKYPNLASVQMGDRVQGQFEIRPRITAFIAPEKLAMLNYESGLMRPRKPEPYNPFLVDVFGLGAVMIAALLGPDHFRHVFSLPEFLPRSNVSRDSMKDARDLISSFRVPEEWIDLLSYMVTSDVQQRWSISQIEAYYEGVKTSKGQFFKKNGPGSSK